MQFNTAMTPYTLPLAAVVILVVELEMEKAVVEGCSSDKRPGSVNERP